ncbi:MAG: low molecular weight phosphatase family protein [Gammaproteobacteria bacterium]|nr:low molecular weight phosphatase family protein [Gammaproteobacteria bacterium]
MNLLEQGKRRFTTRYGSQKGFVRTYWHRFLYLTGRYRDYQQIDWQSIDRLVFVCRGNICRSAYAEVVARSLGMEAISCGLDTREGLPANRDAIRMARQMGHHLEEHKTTPIMYLILRRSDLIVTMEPWHAEFLRQHLIRKHYCTLLGLWSQPVLPHIQDPFGASDAYFQQCFTQIEQSVYEIAKLFKRQTH